MAAGYDVYAVQEAEVPPHGQALIDIGIALEIKPGWYGRIAPRSGLALKGISVGAGVIDPDYQGEIKALLFKKVFGDQRHQMPTSSIIFSASGTLNSPEMSLGRMESCNCCNTRFSFPSNNCFFANGVVSSLNFVSTIFFRN